MSVAEELHKTIDELTEEQQLALLETARQFLREESDAEDDNPEYSALLQELLMKRYEEHKANPQRAIPLEQFIERMNQKYDRKF